MFSSGDCYPTADMVDFSESATKYAGFNVFWFCKPLTQLCTCYWLCPLEMSFVFEMGFVSNHSPYVKAKFWHGNLF